MIDIQIANYQLKPALGVISITGSAHTASYYNNAVGINLQECWLITSMEMTCSKVPSKTQFYPYYEFKHAPITYLSESRNVGTGLYTQYVAIEYPSLYSRAMAQDGVTVKLREVRVIAFDKRNMEISDYVRFG